MIMSQELTKLATTAIDECSELARLQALIEICADQVFASPALAPETMQERVGLLLSSYLDRAIELQADLKLTLERIHQQTGRLSEFEGVRHG